MPKFLALTPMLRVPDFDATIAFWTGVLGFELAARNDDWQWARLRRGATSVMLGPLNEHEGDVRPLFTGSLYFRVDDVEEIWARLEDRARICYAPETFEWGMREFGVYDNNGYLLQFGQEIAP
jgi:catechol 2,3-dioxygenase-like lactoylglutathione lyase family enzyme